MSYFRPSPFLRRVLIADAAASAATGLMVLLAAGPLEGLLGIPATLLREAGLVLIPYVVFVGYVASRETVTTPAVWAIIACNALWAVASFGLLVSGWISPTLLGYAFVVAQALVVAILGELQYVGLRRPTASAA